MPINSFDHYPLSWKPDISRLSRPYYLSLARDLEEKIVYIAETLQNPQAANNLLDDEPNEGWCMMLLKPM